jgi:hypothetical protein
MTMTLQRPTGHRTRGDLLADLAASINELTERRHHTEHVIRNVTLEVDTGRRKKARRSRQRTAHTVTLPSLLDSLSLAAVPGASESGPSGGGFESRPAAELDAIYVLRTIAVGATNWAHTLGVTRATLPGMLRGLVSAQHTDDQLRTLQREVERWVRLARIATGFDAPPMTIDNPCPSCGRKNCLVVTGDLNRVHCRRCGEVWDHDTVAMLAELIRVNTKQRTVADVPCHWVDCTRRGPHDLHGDHCGRTWRNTDRCVDENGVPVRGDVSPPAPDGS